MEWDPIRIRALRAALRLPQERFAHKLGASPKTVRNWERGSHPPGLTLQRALDDAFESASRSQKQRFFAGLDSGPEAAADQDGLVRQEDGATQPSRVGQDRTAQGQAIEPLDTLTARVLNAASMESMELSRQAEASDVGPATLDHLDSMVERFGLAYLFTAASDLFVRVRSCRQWLDGP